MFFKGQYMRHLFAFICCIVSHSVFAKAYTYSVSGSLPSQIAAYTSPVAITVTITNTSGGSYGLGATINGDQNWVAGSNTCVLTQALANGASCQIQGEFNPQYANNNSQLSLAVTIYPGIKITPVVLMSTTVTQSESISITPIQQDAPALYSGLQVTNNAAFSQNITITNNTPSNPQEIIPCTYASGLNQCPSTVSSGLCPADEGGSMTLTAGQSCNLWYVAQTNTSNSDSGTIALTLTPNLTPAVNASFDFSYFSSLYAGGLFTATFVGAVSVNRVASWNGAEWSALSYGLNNTVSTMASDQNGNLYVGGSFDYACNDPTCSPLSFVSTRRIAMWNGTIWQALDSGVSGAGATVSALAFDANHNRIYVGGNFSGTGGISSPHIAYWDTVSQTWVGVPDVGGTVNALAYDNVNDLLYAGGSFTGGVAVLNGSTWTTLGSGVSTGTVFALSLGAITSSGRNVMIGGSFIYPPSPRLVLWNGSAFVPTGETPSGVTRNVNALATLSTSNGDETYFGGSFLQVGTETYNRIGYVNYSSSIFSFSPLIENSGAGFTAGQVNATQFLGLNTVVMGGTFTVPTSTSITLNRIGEWNGSEWISLNNGFTNAVNSVLSVPTILIN